jgi:hypothetical protein
MGDSTTTRNASTSDRNDPSNYVSFDDYVEGSSRIWSTQELARFWNAAHPDSPIRAFGDPIVPLAAPQSDALLDCGMTRAFAAVQLVGGGLEVIVAGGALLAPEPTGVTKVLGAVVLLHGVDTLQASIRTLLTCDRTATVTQQGASSIARYAGASPRTAQTIGVVTDAGIGVGGSFAVGTLSRLAPGASQLVHLTNADSAAAIRASEALGLGRSTIYAGPEALAQSKGWSIIARTGLKPSQATEAILLPSRANSAFLVVQPMGPFSAWQRLSGTVFSAGTGTLNLATGTFTRTGVATNQLVIYGTDMAVMTALRATPDLLERQAGR